MQGRFDEDSDPPLIPEPELEVSENPVVGVLYAPDGSVLSEVHERDTIPFGFHPGR